MAETNDGSRIRAESRRYFVALGAHISRLRKLKGYTQAELASAIGVSQQAVFAYEIGERRVSVLLLIKLARAFRVSVQELVSLARPVSISKPRVSPRAHRHAERLQKLSKTQQHFVVKIIDCLEERNAGSK